MTDNFKQQQQDRADEGKELKHEDELRDVSQIPSKELPGVQNSSILNKISQGISNVATTISEKVGLSEPTVEGHEDLDQNVRKQVKKVNKEILKHAAEKGPEVEKVNEWEKSLSKQVKSEVEGAKGEVENAASKVSQKADQVKESAKPTEGPSIAEKVKQSVSGISGSISQGVDSIKQRFSGQTEEPKNEDGTKSFRTVKDGINESVDDLKHEQRIEELGQSELSSNNPFQPLTSGSNEEGENRTLGEKVRGGLQDASQKISSTVGGVTQKVKSTFVHKEPTAQDKENAQQIA